MYLGEQLSGFIEENTFSREPPAGGVVVDARQQRDLRVIPAFRASTTGARAHDTDKYQ